MRVEADELGARADVGEQRFGVAGVFCARTGGPGPRGIRARGGDVGVPLGGAQMPGAPLWGRGCPLAGNSLAPLVSEAPVRRAEGFEERVGARRRQTGEEGE